MSSDKGLFLLRALEIPLRRKWIRFRTIASKKEICGQVAQLVTHSGNCENENLALKQILSPRPCVAACRAKFPRYGSAVALHYSIADNVELAFKFIAFRGACNGRAIKVTCMRAYRVHSLFAIWLFNWIRVNLEAHAGYVCQHGLV